MRYNELGNLVC